MLFVVRRPADPQAIEAGIDPGRGRDNQREAVPPGPSAAECDARQP